MSITVAVEVLGLLGRLVFDIYKWSQEHTAEAEQKELDNEGKHKLVDSIINDKIDNYTLREDYKTLLPGTVAAVKNEARKHIERHIKEAVANKKGR
jgi:hypothetical protein